MRIFGGIMAGIAAGLALLWILYVRAPPPELVCQHILDVTLAEASDRAMSPEAQGALLDRMRQQCIQHKRDKIKLRGKIQYASYAKCVMEADTLAAIESC